MLHTPKFSLISDVDYKVHTTYLSQSHCLKITQNVAFDFSLWHFPPVFVLSKLTCLVTLFDRKLQYFKNLPKWIIFGILNQLLSTQNVNVARFARNIECDFFCDLDLQNWKRFCSLSFTTPQKVISDIFFSSSTTK